MTINFRIPALILFVIFSLSFCDFQGHNTEPVSAPKYRTKNALIIIMDGARYSETWGDSTHTNIPFISGEIAPEAVVNTAFYNDGPTYTLAGHSSITTGYYAEINNSGLENPGHPSVFQYFNKSNGSKENLSWIVTSKDKLSVLSDCTDPAWNHQFNPLFNCGTTGTGTGCGYRNDSLTCVKALEVLGNQHPRLMLVNFEEPDGSGHSGVWRDYISSITKTDKYIYQLWSFLQHDKFYKSNTAIFITNDHGRHIDGVQSGFNNHGCPCDGCRHLFFVATGPDFKQGETINHHYDLVDIPTTIAALMGFPFSGEGEVMTEILK